MAKRSVIRQAPEAVVLGAGVLIFFFVGAGDAGP